MPRMLLLPRPVPVLLLALAGAVLGGCFGGGALRQINDQLAHTDIALPPGDLERHGVGFLTPAASLTREADKQALALAFAAQLEEQRPGVPVVRLPALLSAVNAANLDQEYKRMYRDYLQTGILAGDVLARVGAAGGARYLVQLNLANFDSQSRGRLSLLGLRFLDTKIANLRVFMQVWDSESGQVVWEGGGELNYTYETGAERPVFFLQVAREAARRLYAELPAAVPAESPP